MNSLESKLIIYIPKKKQYYSFSKKNNSKAYYLDLFGLFGYSAKINEKISIKNPKNSNIYNPLIDIKTDEPLLTIPIFNTNNLNICVFQFINVEKKINSDSYYFDDQLTNYLINFLQICLENLIKNNF